MRAVWSLCVRLTGRRLLPECPMWCLGHATDQKWTGDE